TDSRLARQQESIVALGRLALGNATLDELLDETTVRVARALDVELVKVLQVVSGGEELLLRAGIGWDDGIVGHARLGTGLDSQAGFTLRSDGAVVVLDLATEERFHGPPLLSAHGVVSGMSVIIRPPDGPWGVLGAHTRARRTFSALDVHFLESMA